MFKFQRYFATASFIAIVGAAALLDLYYRELATDDLVAITQHDNVILARMFSNTLWPEYSDYFRQASDLNRRQLLEHAGTQQLAQAVRKLVTGLPVLKLKVFDTSGKVLYSTDPAQIGLHDPTEVLREQVAREGRPASELVFLERFHGLGGVRQGVRVLSSYVPVMEEGAAGPQAVLEVYTDVTALFDRIEQTRSRVIQAVLAVLGLLYAGLYLVTRRADQRIMKEQLRNRHNTELLTRFGRIVDGSSNEIYVFDADTLLFVQANRGAYENLGYTPHELLTMTPADINPEYDLQAFEACLAPVLAGEREQVKLETIHQRKDGSTYPVELRLQLSRSETPPVFVALVLDITERKQAEARLNHLAYYDDLTGLPNRALFADRMHQAMSEADRHECMAAIMYLDLDLFKHINDSLGHDAGDSLLVQVARRLSGAVREGDTVARMGGDEFTIILPDVGHVNEVSMVADRIMTVFSEPFRVEDRDLYISASIGITLYPLDDCDLEGLLKDADTAMYHAKDAGRNRYQFYSTQMTAQAMDRLQIEHGLRRALAEDEFEIHYQPKVNLHSGAITGMEALLRWRHPKQGLLSPGHFIGVAEETGLIVPLGEWVLRRACVETRRLQCAGFPRLSVAVNISARQFHSDLVETVSRILEESRLSACYLELEITESLLMGDARELTEMLEQLAGLGVKLLIDDFGTGYSSLNYLKRFPIHALKIDRSFVKDITTNPDDAAITTAIINMAHSLGLETVAEGVEQEEQLDFLVSRACDFMQGFYFSRPVPADELLQMLQAGRSLSPATSRIRPVGGLGGGRSA